MRIKQLLETSGDEAIADALIDAVRKAAPFFRKRGTSTRLLYRGASGGDELVNVKIRTPRADRRPRDSLAAVHDALDEALYREFGVRYRSAAVFATSDDDVAAEYGHVHVLLPLGEFSYCWGRQVDDALIQFGARKFVDFCNKHGSATLTQVIDGMKHTGAYVGPAYREAVTELIATHPEAAELFKQWFYAQFRDAQYTTEDLGAALDSGHEVMIACQQYALINARYVSHHVIRQVAEKLGNPAAFREILDAASYARTTVLIHMIAGAVI